jgi:hypothetical protein
VQAEHVAVPDERLPSVEVAAVRLARHAAAEPLKVALDDRTPFLQAVRGSGGWTAGSGAARIVARSE